MAEEYDVPDEEKKQIATHFLLSSPPGQIHDVLADLQKLVPPHILEPTMLAKVFRTFNLEHYVTCPVPGFEHNLIVSPVTEVDADHYLDPRSRTVVGFDHVRQAPIDGDVRAVAAGELDDSIEDWRLAVEQGVLGYVDTHFASSRATGVVTSSAGTLTALVSGYRINLRSFWSGFWRSSWSVVPSAGSATVSGKVLIHIHYFEDGNVQMKTERDFGPFTVSAATPEECAEEATKIIVGEESALQGALEEMYSNMSSETFKEMRRIMPITRTKMEWNPQAHRMVRHLRD
eukprot:PLAT4706.21.p1 GENE.PLAT4706.21~~PLAT4706.21.p1  ORF type:complete len:288 (-),score=139.35 PLAT4706.21:143-1006(-)